MKADAGRSQNSFSDPDSYSSGPGGWGGASDSEHFRGLGFRNQGLCTCMKYCVASWLGQLKGVGVGWFIYVYLVLFSEVT